MGKANKLIVGSADAHVYTYYDFINAFNCPVIKSMEVVSGPELVINFDDIVEVRITLVPGGGGYFKAIYNGTETSYNSGNVARGMTLRAACSDQFFYFYTVDNRGNTPVIFIYENIGSTRYYGIQNVTTLAGLPLTSITDGLTYTHGARLNYSAGITAINFAADVLFREGVKITEDSNFIACTTVAADNIITFEGTSYYSITGHMLVALDDEESA